jgi:hypothetical protein
VTRSPPTQECDPGPAQVGRLHALQRLAECATALADARPVPDNLPPDDRAYLAAYVATCRSVADWLTTSAKASA